MERKSTIEKEFISNGLKCYVVANNWGHRCGYVAVPKDHKYFEQDYCANNYEIASKFDVHGGITFSGRLKSLIEDEWLLGFDCAHLGDAKDISIMSEDNIKFQKEMDDRFGHNIGYDTIKDCAYVERECISLAKQISEIK